MKNNSNIVSLYNLNNHLSKKMKHYPAFYSLVILLGSIFVAIVVGVPLFTNFVEFNNLYEEQSFFNSMIYLLVSGDILIICVRFSSRTLIEPIQIVTYPIRNSLKSLLNICILLCDWRCIPYIIFSIIITIYLALNFYLFGIIVTILLLLLWVFSRSSG